MNVFQATILTGLSALTLAQAEVKMQAVQHKQTTVIHWQYAPGTQPLAETVLQRRCGMEKNWKALHKGTIPLALETDKPLPYLSARRQQEARQALQNALEKKSMSGPLSGDSLRTILASSDGPLVSAILFIPDPGLAMYAGMGFLDDQPGKNCEYGLFPGGSANPAVTSRSIPASLRFSRASMQPSRWENQAEIRWIYQSGENMPVASVRFSAYRIDDKAQPVPLFQSVQCLNGSDTCSWNTELSHFNQQSKAKIRIEASFPGLGQLDQTTFTAYVPIAKEVWQSLRPVIATSQDSRKEIRWNATHHFTKDTPVDSTVIVISEYGDNVRFRQSYKGLRSEGTIAVEPGLSGEDITDNGMPWSFSATFHSPLGDWISYTNIHVQPSYELMRERLEWEAEPQWDSTQTHLRIPVQGLKQNPGEGKRFLIIDRTQHIPYDARKKRYPQDTLIVPIPDSAIRSSVLLCEQVGVQRYCRHMDYPDKP